MNERLIVQDAFTGTIAPQVLVSVKSAAFVPLMLREPRVMSAVPQFVNVAVMGALCERNTWPMKKKAPGVRQPLAEPTLVPERFTSWGLVPSESVMVKVPAKGCMF